MVVIGAGGCTVKVSVIAKKEAWNEVISRPLLEVGVNSEGACNQYIYGIQQIKSLVHFKSQIFDNDTLTHLPTYPCPCNINFFRLHFCLEGVVCGKTTRNPTTWEVVLLTFTSPW